MKKNIISISILFCSFISFSQENVTYQNPPKEILELADYQRPPSVFIDSKAEYMLLAYSNTYKSLNDLNQEEIKLAGLRINPITNISSTAYYFNNIKIKKVADKVEKQVEGLPNNANITNLKWSPNQKKIAFTNTTSTGVELWVIDIATAKASKLTDAVLNANMSTPFVWYTDNENLLVKFLPKDRPTLIDSKKDLPLGPTVSTSVGGTKSQNRTYQDLLKSPADEKNFEILVASELYKVNLSGKADLFKTKDLYNSISFSPDGNYVLINTISRPFSYIVPLFRFPVKTNIYKANGEFVKLVNDVPLTEIMPKGFMAVRKGKRDMAWRDDKPATLYFVEALDEGNPENKADFRDELFVWDAPFAQEPKSILKTIQRFDGVVWGNETTAIAYDNWHDTRNTKTYLFNPANEKQAPKIIFDRNRQDIYSDPGNFETTKNVYGRDVLAIENGTAFLVGDGFTKEGQFPFIDEFSLATQKTKRLYQSNLKDKMERIFSVIDFKKGLALVRIESKSEYPNYYLRNIKTKANPQAITNFSNPFVSLNGVYKELIKYKRKDGVELSGTLYLPANYDKTKKEKLPLLIWAYPQEFKDKSSAGQTSNNPNEFTFPYYGSFVYWVTRGYAVLDDAAFPIVGEGKTEPNDTFIEQLIDNAEAAINAVDNLGFIDKNKVAVGGHSYGAFMTANLLSHTKLFACGIARSGAYNRTLTPFGFQGEQRNYWEAIDVYTKISPFSSAEKMKTPLLLVHGEADNNPGTFTLQTERYFQALKGLGAPVRMVILPKESHSYVAKESIFHLLWEQEQFLEKHLKGNK
ncbi:MAG: prolyl oligopeptidase family serine peptidase [Bacteroidota bacterium]